MRAAVTCAGLRSDGHNATCPRRDQCARFVPWIDDPRASYNLCSPHGSESYRHFMAHAEAEAAAPTNQSAAKPAPQELFA